jgi:hypothetical protein
MFEESHCIKLILEFSHDFELQPSNDKEEMQQINKTQI